MFLRRRFRSGYLRGSRRGTDVSFCVDGGQVDFEGSFAYFFGGFPFYLFVCLFLCFPVFVASPDGVWRLFLGSRCVCDV